MDKLGNCVDHICQEDQIDQPVGRNIHHREQFGENETLKDKEHIAQKTIPIKESDPPTMEQALSKNRDGNPILHGLNPDCPSDEEMLSKVNYVQTEIPTEEEIAQGLDIINADGNSMDWRG